MNGVIQDVRHALRQLRRSPGFTRIAISPADPAALLAAALLLIVFAAAASYIPARRAARVDPMVALRDE